MSPATSTQRADREPKADSRQRRAPTEERLFLADGGLETTLIFDHGMQLPCFAAIPAEWLR